MQAALISMRILAHSTLPMRVSLRMVTVMVSFLRGGCLLEARSQHCQT